MTNVTILASVVVAIMAVLASLTTLRHIRIQQEAEIRLSHSLARDRAFRSTMEDYIEACDRYGPQGAGDLRQRVEILIVQRLEVVGEGKKFVAEALGQPSPVGRDRYLEKILEEVTNRVPDEDMPLINA